MTSVNEIALRLPTEREVAINEMLVGAERQGIIERGMSYVAIADALEQSGADLSNNDRKRIRKQVRAAYVRQAVLDVLIST
ncbi:hypothetical protein HGB25_01400 [Candidatus Saccharibacteria bacterium]|nr:hypothetical protein [Candidatus Saccharibacteria bacterium]